MPTLHLDQRSFPRTARLDGIGTIWQGLNAYWSTIVMAIQNRGCNRMPQTTTAIATGNNSSHNTTVVTSSTKSTVKTCCRQAVTHRGKPQNRTFIEGPHSSRDRTATTTKVGTSTANYWAGHPAHTRRFTLTWATCADFPKGTSAALAAPPLANDHIASRTQFHLVGPPEPGLPDPPDAFQTQGPRKRA